MNNFNKILSVVKHHCKDGRFKAGEDCYIAVSELAGVQLKKLDIFLNRLRNLELVEYSKEDQYIRLTPIGDAV